MIRLFLALPIASGLGLTLFSFMAWMVDNGHQRAPDKSESLTFNMVMMEQEQEKETPLAKAQSDNSRAYTNTDPKEKALISKLEASLLQMAADTNLLADPAVIRALKLLNQALTKAK